MLTPEEECRMSPDDVLKWTKEKLESDKSLGKISRKRALDSIKEIQKWPGKIREKQEITDSLLELSEKDRAALLIALQELQRIFQR